MTIGNIDANGKNTHAGSSAFASAPIETTPAVSSTYFASAPTEDQLVSAGSDFSVAVVNAEPVMDPHDHIPLVQVTSVDPPAQRNGSTSGQPAQSSVQIPVAYSTGKPPQPPPRPQPILSSSVVVATGSPSDQINRNSTRNRDCCAGWTCCGITIIVLTSIFVCCFLPIIITAVAIGRASHAILTANDDISFWDNDYGD